MLIELKKFGTTLTSRQTGKEAFAAFTPALKEISQKEKVEINFEGINTLSPSWADEFLTPLREKYGRRLFLRTSNNPSVKATLKILEVTNDVEFKLV